MKSIHKLTVFLLVFLAVSCGDDLADLNIDPNASPTARPQEVLTAAQGYWAFVQDGRYNDLACLWAEYWTWGPGVSLGNDARYVAEPDDHDLLWARAYSNCLTDLKYLTNSGESAYVGIAKIMQAHVFQGLVDHFGDIPYSQAINGSFEDGSNLAPAFDDDAAIYPQLVLLIDEGLAELEKGGTVGGEDLIYGGALDKWTTFGKSLKLRILMRQSGVVDVAADVQALIASGGLMESGDDIAAMEYLGTAGDENPMFAVFEAGIGNFYIASNATLNVLNDLGDPRIDAFYDIAPNIGSIVGVDQGDIDSQGFTVVRQDYSQGSAITYGPGVSTIFMSNWEVWFLRSEAAMRFGTSDSDAGAFSSGVEASFDYLGVEGASAYVSSLNFAGDKIGNIATQKWISMNGLQESEAWIENRRLDTPDNPIFTNGHYQTPSFSALPENTFPSIWLYPDNELSLNPNAPDQHGGLTDKVFWDN